MKQIYVVGVDISKSKVDIAFMNSSYEVFVEKEVINSDVKLRSFLNSVLKKFKIEPVELLVCCESTGIYNAPLRRICVELGVSLWEVQALKIKRASADLRGKSDRKDALRIADYAVRYNDQQQLYTAPEENVRTLDALNKSRDTLVVQRVMLNNQLKEAESHDPALYKLLKANYRRAMNALEKSIKQLEKEIDVLIKKDDELRTNKELLLTITGIGPQIANNLIIITNNFHDFSNAKQLACYAGVVPFENASGTIIKRSRVSKLANKKLKQLIHLAALSVIKTTGDLKDYYVRKVKEGKNKMSVINALRNKLIHRIMAVISRRTPYIKNQEDYYQNNNQNTCFLT